MMMLSETEGERANNQSIAMASFSFSSSFVKKTTSRCSPQAEEAGEDDHRVQGSKKGQFWKRSEKKKERDDAAACCFFSSKRGEKRK